MKGQMLKLFVVLAVCLSIVAGCVPSPASAPVQPTATPIPPTPTPLDVVQKYQDAYARHDMDAAMSLFTDDAKYAWGEYFTTTDRTMIRNWLEYDAALNVQTTVNNCKPTDSTVTCEWRFVNDCFGANGTGSNDMNGVIVFTVREGMISDFLYTDNPNPAEGQWEEDFFTWLAATYPTEPVLETLGAKKFDRNFGQHLDKLCKEYWEGKKPATTSTSDPAAPVQAWVAAMNSGDVDAALVLFTDDLKFDVFEYHARNRDELRGIFDWLAGLETKYQIKECQTKEDRVVCTMPGSDACIAGYDPVNGLASTMTFVPTQDGKIAQVNGMLDGFNDYYAKWISPAMTWMRANRADDLAKAEATKDGREAGAINAKLCKEYGESLKATAGATADLTAPVKAWVDAINRGDVDAALAPFADDVEYHFIFDAIRKENVRSVFDWLVGIEARYKIVDCQQPQSDRVECAFTVSDGCIIPYGAVDSLAVKGVYVFGDDGKIKEVTGATEGVEWDNYWKYGDAVLAWQKANRAEEASKVENSPPKEGGAVQIKLCQEYAESLKATPVATKAPAATSDQLKVVQAYHAAISSGDVDAALALLTDDAKLRGVYYGTGKEAVLWIFDWLVGQETKYGPADCQIQDERVVCAVTISDACIAAYGATGGLPWKGVYVVGQDGKIQEATETKEGAKWDDFDKFGQLVSAWAITNRADELPADGMNKDSGIAFAKLCKEYAASLK